MVSTLHRSFSKKVLILSVQRDITRIAWKRCVETRIYVTKYGAPVKGVEVQIFPGNSVYPSSHKHGGLQLILMALPHLNSLSPLTFLLVASMTMQASPGTFSPIDGQVYICTPSLSVQVRIRALLSHSRM